MGTCSKCGSDRIMANVRLVDRTGHTSAEDLTAEVYEYPNALFFNGAVGVTLRAHICGSCGYSELYADTPEGLWQAYCTSLGERGMVRSQGLPVVGDSLPEGHDPSAR
jgi:hypothetical protein